MNRALRRLQQNPDHLGVQTALPQGRDRHMILATLLRAPLPPSCASQGGWPEAHVGVAGAPGSFLWHRVRRGAGTGISRSPPPLPPGPWRQRGAMARLTPPSRALRPAPRRRPPVPTCGRGWLRGPRRALRGAARPLRGARGAGPLWARAALRCRLLSSAAPRSSPAPSPLAGSSRAGGGTAGEGGAGVRGRDQEAEHKKVTRPLEAGLPVAPPPTAQSAAALPGRPLSLA